MLNSRNMKQYIMMDSYLVDIDNRNRVYRFFGLYFFLIDTWLITEREYQILKKSLIRIHKKMETQSMMILRALLDNMISELDMISTVTGKKYGEIFLKIEVKKFRKHMHLRLWVIQNILKHQNPRFIYNVRTRRKPVMKMRWWHKLIQ